MGLVFMALVLIPRIILMFFRAVFILFYPIWLLILAIVVYKAIRNYLNKQNQPYPSVYIPPQDDDEHDFQDLQRSNLKK